MNELYKMVQERQEKISRLVDDKKAEIEALQAESKKLDDFLNLGKELFDQGEVTSPSQAPQQTPPQAQAAPQPAPQPQAVQAVPPKEAAKSAPVEMPRVLPARQPREQDQSPKLA